MDGIEINNNDNGIESPSHSSTQLRSEDFSFRGPLASEQPTTEEPAIEDATDEDQVIEVPSSEELSSDDREVEEVQRIWPSADHDTLLRTWNTYDALIVDVQQYATESGFGIYKMRSSDFVHKHDPAKKEATRCDLSCVHDNCRLSKSRGIRKTSIKKQDCQWRATARRLRHEGARWSFVIRKGCNAHNHAPANRPEGVPVHNRLKLEHKLFIAEFTYKPTVAPRDIDILLRERFPDAHYVMQDLRNYRYKCRRDANLGYTPMQATIKLLDDEKLKYKVLWEDTDETVRWSQDDPAAFEDNDNDNNVSMQLDDNGANNRGWKPVAVWWSTPSCERVWQEFPYVHLFDNTYKTNNKGWAFSQIVTMSNLGLALSCAFAVVNNERQEGYDWIIDQHNRHRQLLTPTPPPPSVVLTDYEQAMKNALSRVYPKAEQQLCIFHVNKNVVLYTRRKWDKKEAARVRALADAGLTYTPNNETYKRNEGNLGEKDLSDRDSAVEDLDEEDQGVVNRLNKRAAENAVLSEPIPETVEYSRAGFYKLWEHVLYADTVDEFDVAWKKLKAVFKAQTELIEYIESTYMTLKEQWASCYVNKRRNFGARTTSPVESINRLFKSFVVTARSTMHQVVKQSLQMAKHMERNAMEKRGCKLPEQESMS